MATRYQTGSSARAAGVRTAPNELSALAAYLAEFAKSPLAVGSPIPTFRHTVNRLLAPVDWQRVKLLVEYGPGTGRFTAGALARMRPDATLIAIDSSDGFTDHLRAAIRDRRLRAVTGSAQEVESLVAEQGLTRADCILSGLPFSTLPDGDGEAIIAASRLLLRTGGQFVAYQVRGGIRRLLDGHFRTVEHAREWLNLPPYHLYWCRK